MLTCCLRFHSGRVKMALPIVTSYYVHFTRSYEYFTNRYVYFTNCLQFGERYKTTICFSHMPCCRSGCQLSNDGTLNFVGYIYILVENRKDS